MGLSLISNTQTLPAFLVKIGIRGEDLWYLWTKMACIEHGLLLDSKSGVRGVTPAQGMCTGGKHCRNLADQHQCCIPHLFTPMAAFIAVILTRSFLFAHYTLPTLY